MNKILTNSFLTLMLLLSLGNIACSGNANKPAPDQVSTDKSIPKETVDPAQSEHEELEKKSPFTLDQLKAILPEELIGAKLTISEAKSNMGAAFASATYVLNDSASIDLNIFDCAGTEGAGIYDRQYLELLKSGSPDDATKYSVGDFKGSKAMMQENKKDDIYNFTWLSQKRFLVILEGKFIGIELLKQAAASINFPK